MTSRRAPENDRPPTTREPRPPRTEAQSLSETTLELQVPAQLIEAIAQGVAERLRDELASITGLSSPWLDFDAACSYLGFNHNTLYKLTAARAIPCRKRAGGQGLRFHRQELDSWMESAYPRLDRHG